MKQFLKILAFELRSRWFLSFFPLIYIGCFLPILLTQRDSVFALTLTPGYFFIFQNAIMLVAIFQNRPWGSPASGGLTLEFLFSRALDRGQLYWVKMAIYLVSSALFGLTYFAYAGIKPSIAVDLPAQQGERREMQEAFYLEHFAGAHVESRRDKTRTREVVVLPHGQMAVALTITVMCLGFAALYQLVVALAPETKVATFCLLGVFLVLLVTMPFFQLKPRQGPISDYERMVGMVGHHPLLTLIALALVVGAVQAYCYVRFVRKEIL